MRKFAFLALLLLFACTKESGTVAEKPLVEDPYFSVKQDKKVLVDPGQTVTFSVSTNIDPEDWDYSASAEGLVLVSKDTASLVLAVSDDLDMLQDRAITVSLSSSKYPSCEAQFKVTIKKAMIVDVSFNADGTATDLSSNTYMISSYPGSNLVTYLNEDTGTYCARFFNPLGADITDSYYSISYSSSTAIKKALEDGHSFEVQFMMSTENDYDGELGILSATEAGGSGIKLTTNKDIAFAPYVNSKWCYAQSKVVPQAGEFYHVVGVWNQTEGKAYIYVNGELKGTKDAKGTIGWPSSTTAQWIGIGADVASSGAEAAWTGDIVCARVYDAALSEAAVKKLWNNAFKDFKAQNISLSDILYFPECSVNIGSQLRICAEGLKDGDKVVMTSDKTTYECSTIYKSGKVIYTIPADFVSGTYQLNIQRGSSRYAVGTVSYTVTSDPVSWKAPGIVAHRGAWNEYNLPENSIASLAKAQELGCFASEMDIWVTTDTVLYVNHDGKIGGKTIQASKSSDLENITLSNGEKLPTFQEYLNQLKKSPGTKLSIEIKEHTNQERDFLCVDEAVRILKENGLLRQVEWNSFSWDACVRVITDDPEASVYYQMPDTSLSLDTMQQTGFLGADYDKNDLYEHPEIIEKAHSLGMYIVAGSVNDNTYYINCMAWGIDQISTNYPGRFTEIASRMFD